MRVLSKYVPVMSGESRGKEAFIAGLGNLKYKAPKPPCTMHEARVKIYSDEECRKMLNKAEGGGDQFINGLCAGYLEGGIDACQVRHKRHPTIFD